MILAVMAAGSSWGWCPSCGSDDLWVPELLRVGDGGGAELILTEWSDPHGRARLARTADGIWEWSEIDIPTYLELVAESDASESACATLVPYENPPVDEAIALRSHLRVGHTVEETPESCVERQGYVFFGLGFYEGEGVDGVGGIGRYDERTGEIEVRRPVWLRDKSVRHMSDDGRSLWFSLWKQYEKDREEWGLHRYDWDTHILERLGTSSWSPCGTTVIGTLLIEDELFIATDFGLSVLDLVGGEWRHLAREGKRLVGSDCSGQIRSRLMAMIEGTCRSCAPEILMESLRRTQPARLRSMMLNDPALRQLRLLAGFAPLARTFEEFRDSVWSAIPEDADPEVRTVIARAYATTGDRSEEWRDLALSIARETGEWKLLAHFRGDPVVLDALLELAARTPRNDRERWNRGDAAEMIPWVGGAASLPDLIRLLRDAKHEPEMSVDPFYRGLYLSELIRAVERVAHQQIERDGSVTPLQPDSDRVEYAREEFTFALRSTNDVAGLRAIADQWLEWWDEQESPVD